MEDKRELFRAYLDESEDNSGGLYVVGGFVGEAVVWLELEPKWNRCLPAGISCFHATDCVTGNNEFKGMAIADRAALLDNLTTLIIAHEIWLISNAIDATAYKRLATKPWRNEFLMNKYAAPFGGVVAEACRVMGNIPGPSDWEILTHGDHWGKCAFFIEKSEYDASAADTISCMRTDSTLWFRNRIGRDMYGTKSGRDAIPLLQVADLGAYLAARHRGNAPEDKISWKTYYDKLRNAKRVRPTILADSRSLELLNKTLQDEKKRHTVGI
jgi:hypothetical protein